MRPPVRKIDPPPGSNRATWPRRAFVPCVNPPLQSGTPICPLRQRASPVRNFELTHAFSQDRAQVGGLAPVQAVRRKPGKIYGLSVDLRYKTANLCLRIRYGPWSTVMA